MRKPTGSPRLKRLCNAQFPGTPGLPRNNVTSPYTINSAFGRSSRRWRCLKRRDRRALGGDERDSHDTQNGSIRWIHGRSVPDLRPPLQCTAIGSLAVRPSSSCDSFQRWRSRPISGPHDRNSRRPFRSRCPECERTARSGWVARLTNSAPQPTDASNSGRMPPVLCASSSPQPASRKLIVAGVGRLPQPAPDAAAGALLRSRQRDVVAHRCAARGSVSDHDGSLER